MSKQPFLPLFVGDFLAATFTWSGEEQALYLLLLAYQWGSGPLPNDARRLARAVRYDERTFRKLWPTVSGKFIETEGGLLNPRLEQHRAKADAIAEKNRTSGRAGADARWRLNGERHESANGESIASATDPPKGRHESANGGALCHPSHPIPSQIKSEEGEGAPKRRRPSRRCPEDFVPDLEFAIREIPDIDAAAEAEKFRDFEFSKPRSDWPATWRTWVRKARDDGRYARVKTTPVVGEVKPIWQ